MKKTCIFIFLTVVLLFLTSCGEQDESTKIYKVISEEVIVGAGTAYELNGVLTLPKNKEKPYAVVLVHGSGAQDMDENAYAYSTFKDIAEYLSAHGIAVLRYNKRTFTYSAEMQADYKNLTVKEEVIDDAILAAQLLKNDERIDSEKVFILGHSLGGMLAPRIDAEGGDFAGLIIMAGSPRPFAEIWEDQAADNLSTLPDEQKSYAQAQIEAYMSYMTRFREMTDEEAKELSFLGVSGYYHKDMDTHPASDYLTVLSKPILIMHGGKDFQVSTGKDFAEYQALLQGKANATFKLYSELNHFFVTSTTGTMEEYSTKATVDETVLGDIASWIKEN